MIGITSILITGWSFVSMFIPDNLLTSCPFTFKTWTCAGYNSTWIAAWATGGIEMILWILASFSTGIRPFYSTMVFIWMIAGGALMAVPIVFWILAIVIDNVSLSDTLLWQFIVQSSLWVTHVLIHILFFSDLDEWANYDWSLNAVAEV